MINVQLKYRLWIRYGLMLILLINVGYSVYEFKQTFDYIEIENDSSSQSQYNLEINNYYSLNDNSYQDKQSFDASEKRDVELLDICLSLFLFILLRYGVGVHDIRDGNKQK